MREIFSGHEQYDRFSSATAAVKLKIVAGAGNNEVFIRILDIVEILGNGVCNESAQVSYPSLSLPLFPARPVLAVQSPTVSLLLVPRFVFVSCTHVLLLFPPNVQLRARALLQALFPFA